MASDERVDIYLPLYVRDFLTSTIGWTAEEVGHYMRLLMLQWDRGGLPGELQAIERLSPGVGAVWSLLEAKFPVDPDGQRRNQRMEEHRGRSVEVRRRRSAAAERANRARWGATEPDHDRITNGSDSDPNRITIGSETDRQRIANGSHPPSPSPSPSYSDSDAYPSSGNAQQRQRRPREGSSQSAKPQPEDGWTGDVGSQWELLLERWNATPGVKRHQGLQFARSDLLCDRLCDPKWIAEYPQALARLPSCRFFKTPVQLFQFLDENFVADVLVGRYDDDWRDAGASRQRPVKEGTL